MVAVKCKLCVSCVIKTRVVPSGRLVAVLAFLAALTIVRVVFRVAAVTGRRCVLERLIFVASTALRVPVQTDQREVRHVMIELDVEPAGGRVTIATFGSHGFIVNIVFNVARVALGFCIAKLCLGFMATATIHISMIAFQSEVRVLVIEQLPVQYNDNGIPSLMVRMAVRAIIQPRILEQAVKTDDFVDIKGDVLMAVQAQPTLLTAIECLMAGFAIRLVFGMPFDNIARHDQGLHLSIGVCCYEGKCHHHDSCQTKCPCHTAAAVAPSTCVPQARAPGRTGPS